MQLTPEQVKFWHANGYLVLPDFFDRATVERQVALHEHVWRTLPEGIVVDDLDTSLRLRIKHVPKEKRGGRFKLNDFYLNFEETRQISLAPALAALLEQLLIDKPVLCNTLDLDYGTAQGMHVDSLFMTPASPHNLIATWVALEDGHPDTGPLEYYPGSHMIPQFKFSSGSCHVIPEEMPAWNEHMFAWVERLGLKRESFLPKAGDLFIWHAYLMHAGGQIRDPQRTRRSLVSHYFAESDCRMHRMKLRPLNGAFWQERSPQNVPDIDPAKEPERYSRAILNSQQDVAANSAPLQHLLRTTLHHYRRWRQDVFQTPDQG